jgi:FMN-dependent NADH-azoreductase
MTNQVKHIQATDNRSIPGSLKAYIHQVLRVNETFRIGPANRRNPYIGLLENKVRFLLLSRGNQSAHE